MTTASAAPSLPDELRRIQDDLDANERRAMGLLSGLDDAALNWRPDDRSWSTAQCLDHLNVAARVYQAAMEPALEAARRKGRTRRGPIRPGWFERKFLASLEPPPRRKLPAPSKIVPAMRGEPGGAAGGIPAPARETVRADPRLRRSGPGEHPLPEPVPSPPALHGRDRAARDSGARASASLAGGAVADAAGVSGVEIPPDPGRGLTPRTASRSRLQIFRSPPGA